MRDGPSHPICLLAVLVLVLNDHVLKHAVPGVLTGKLSDVAWLIVAPVVVAAVLVRLGASDRASSRVALVGSAAAFTTLQLWPPLGDAWCAVLGGVNTPDPTDLLCLPALLVAPMCWRPVRPVLLALPLAVVALTATKGDYWPAYCPRLPAAEERAWDPNLPLVATWDGARGEPPDLTSLNFEGEVWLRTSGGRDVPFELVLDGYDLILCPVGGLEVDAWYHYRVGPFSNEHPQHLRIANPHIAGAIEFKTAPETAHEPLTLARCRSIARDLVERHPACPDPYDEDTGL